MGVLDQQTTPFSVVQCFQGCIDIVDVQLQSHGWLLAAVPEENATCAVSPGEEEVWAAYVEASELIWTRFWLFGIDAYIFHIRSSTKR